MPVQNLTSRWFPWPFHLVFPVNQQSSHNLILAESATVLQEVAVTHRDVRWPAPASPTQLSHGHSIILQLLWISASLFAATCLSLCLKCFFPGFFVGLSWSRSSDLSLSITLQRKFSWTLGRKELSLLLIVLLPWWWLGLLVGCWASSLKCKVSREMFCLAYYSILNA